MNDGIQFAELLEYTEEETRRWKEFFIRHPETLDLPLDVAGTVRRLILHVFAVELYFANALLGLERVNPDAHSMDTLDDLFAISEHASDLYREFFSKAKPEDWTEMVDLGRIRRRANRRKVAAQSLTHSIRHWAQIATYLRQQGFKQDWHHDLLMSHAMD